MRRCKCGKPVRAEGRYKCLDCRNEYMKEYQLRPEQHAKSKARSKLRNLIANGKLLRKPCEVCGATPSEAHHADYRRATIVWWLCSYHHKLLHKGGRRVKRRARLA